MPRKIRTGIAGCGSIAHQKHLPALQASGLAEITAFCDVNEAAAQAAAAQYGTADARVHTRWEDLCADDGVDSIHICTGNSTHAPIAIAALRAGKHVLCEKPMARSASEGEAMLAAAMESGRTLSVSYQNRFRPEVRQLYARCRAGELGDIYFAKAVAIRRRGIPTWGSFTNLEAQGGGCLIDMGTHAIDLALWLMGNYDIAQVTASTYNRIGKQSGSAGPWGAWNPAAFGVEDAAFAHVRMQNGATLTIECSWALNTLDVGENRVTLCGDRAGADFEDGLRLNGEAGGLLYETRVDAQNAGAMGWTPKNAQTLTHYQAECNAWLTALLNGTEPPVLPRQALCVTRLIDAIYESARTGQPVSFI